MTEHQLRPGEEPSRLQDRTQDGFGKRTIELLIERRRRNRPSRLRFMSSRGTASVSVPLAALLVAALPTACVSSDEARIVLMPVEGKMMVNAMVPSLDQEVFGLGIPETIGSAEEMWLLNHPDAEVQWRVHRGDGRATTSWEVPESIAYELGLIPADDHVDLVMTITNLSATTWHDVFAFNCVSPARAPDLLDESLSRTFVSVGGAPARVSELPRTLGPRPTVTVFATERHEPPPFAAAFGATSPQRSDGSWVVVVSEPGDAYMATTADDAAFLFTNTSFGCIHAAPSFGDIAAGDKATVRARVLFSKGGLGQFLERYERDRAER